MTHKYLLVTDLHFPAEIRGKEVVVTMQRWDADQAAARRSEFAVLHNGRTVRRRIYHRPNDLAHMDAAFDEARQEHVDDLLTDAQARDQIGRITGSSPYLLSCGRDGCPATMPLGDYRCAEGHFRGQVGSGSMSGIMRRPIYLPPAGGKK